MLATDARMCAWEAGWRTENVERGGGHVEAAPGEGAPHERHKDRREDLQKVAATSLGPRELLSPLLRAKGAGATGLPR